LPYFGDQAGWKSEPFWVRAGENAEKTPMKRIVICCDGDWKTPEKDYDLGVGTR
jgi:hypothetical protein